MARRIVAAATLAVCLLTAQPASESARTTGYHLTARPWRPLNIDKSRYLDVIEGEVRFSVRHQNSEGAIIDPFLHREHQYATPYFAYAAGTLAEAGRARDLLPAGIRAMEHATVSVATHTIPDNHGEFFLACLVEALDVYSSLVPAETLNLWRDRLKGPVEKIVRGSLNNWETYAMKAEWLRAKAGLEDRDVAIRFIENAWRARQHARISALPWSIYHDRSSDPDTLSVEAVGRGNLLALINAGYDGPSAAEIRKAVETGTRFTMFLQDPTGQVPANGRTDNHVWVDVGYELAFEVMAERTRTTDPYLAGQYRHASLLAFQSIQRWHRNDPPWDGSFFVTKNHFDPALRVGYQNASEYSNYNGSLMFHLAEVYRSTDAMIEEKPAPTEIGGYTLQMDREFSSVFANAGGMQIQANLRGQKQPSDGNFWTPLGLVRFSRTGWDSRLGPSDGALNATGGVSFAPTFKENGKWLRMADLSSRYEAEWSVQFVHPLLVRCALVYHPQAGQNGPSFRDELIVTPSGVFSDSVQSGGDPVEWGMSWPILADDGAPLEITEGPDIRSVRYPKGRDRENFVAIDSGASIVRENPIRGSYGDLVPFRVGSKGGHQRTFVYPQNENEPVLRDIQVTPEGFSSNVAKVVGNSFSGATSAGGVGKALAGVQFDRDCGFLLQLENGVVSAIETDRPANATIMGKTLRLSAYTPVSSK